MNLESLAIVLTPQGGAAIAVVRLTGPRIGGFLAAHFSRPVSPSRCVHGELTDAGRVIDDPVVVLSADGQSADVNLHGGPWIVPARCWNWRGAAALTSAKTSSFRAVRGDRRGH